jgi:regulator of sigma E protease
MLTTLIIFIVVLSVIVFIHEMGHFYSAIKFGVKVDEFGLGLPPRIFGIQKIDGKFKFVWGKKPIKEGGPTIYSLNWFPIGGFVKIKGEGGEEAEALDSFASKSIWKRMIIISAGVIMNIVLTIFLLIIGFTLGMPAVVDEDTTSGAIVSAKNIQIIELVESGQAKSAGLEVGDIIVSMNGDDFSGISELNEYLIANEGHELEVILDRRGKEVTKDVLVGKYIADNGEEVTGLGIGLIETAIVRYPWYLAIWKGITATFVWLVTIVVAFASIIKNLIVGAPTGVEVAGPVGIAVLTGQAAKLGFVYLLQFTALLSLNLAIINIMPFPALDGGRLLFLIIEKVRGKAVKQEWENVIHNVGFLILMGLVLLVTFGDVVKYGGGFFNMLKGLVGL